eukprot:Sdes_comp18342_c0_seq2m8083
MICVIPINLENPSNANVAPQKQGGFDLPFSHSVKGFALWKESFLLVCLGKPYSDSLHSTVMPSLSPLEIRNSMKLEISIQCQKILPCLQISPPQDSLPMNVSEPAKDFQSPSKAQKISQRLETIEGLLETLQNEVKSLRKELSLMNMS